MKARQRERQPGFGPERALALGPEAWSVFLSAELGTRVEVVFTRARRTVLKVEPRGLERRVRMNAFFAHAPPPVRAAVASWIRSGKRARRKLELLDGWIETQIESVERSAPRPLRSVTAGRVHDLEALARELRRTEFAGEFAPRTEAAPESGALPSWPQLTWGRAPRSSLARVRRSLRLGSFDYWSGVVRLHPVLDQPCVPESFVRYVLFHELLHAALPAERGKRGRRVFHSREFRRREHEYAGTRAALAWEEEHLQELLWSARTGQEMRPAKMVARSIAARDQRPAGARQSQSRPSGAYDGLRRFVQRWLSS